MKRNCGAPRPASARGFRRVLNVGKLVAALLSFICVITHAATPTLEYLFPVAWPQGETLTLTLGGKFDPWPVKVWTDCAGLHFTAETNSGKFLVQIAKDAPIGPHLLRVFNQDGASALRVFITTPQKDGEEKEPNDSFKQAQPIEKLPATITGRLDKGGDVDSFAVRVEAGKWLGARVDAYSLGSPLDATLHLVNEQGVHVAFNHDGPQSMDPLLAYRVEKSGTSILQVAGFAHPPEANVKFAGGAAAIYRLTMTDGPLVHHVFPTGVQRGHTAQLQLLGWNLGTAEQPKEQSFAAASLDAQIPKYPNTQSEANAVAAWVSVPGSQAQIPVIIGDMPEFIEAEPNNETNQAQLVSLPCAISGRIASLEDEDRFRFTAKQGERFEFRAASAAPGSPLDLVLRIEDASGKVLAEDDDGGGGSDARLVWASPSDGSFTASVSDRFHKGGGEFVYRLVIVPPKPDFRVTVAENEFRLEPGQTNEIKLELKRLNDHTNSLRVAFEELPAGVTLQPPEVPLKSGEVKLSVMTTADAQPTNQPLRILVQATDASLPKSRPALFDLRGKDPRGQILITYTDQLWLTVIPKPEPPAKPEEKKP